MKMVKLKVLRMLSLYSVGALFSNLVGLFTIPILFTTLGSAAWGEIVIAQSIGTILALIIDLGYSNFAPAKISTLTEHEKVLFYSISLRNRFKVFLFFFIVILVLELLSVFKFSSTAILVIIAYAVQGLSSSWLFVAQNDAKSYLLKIMAPRTMGILSGAILCFAFPSGLSFAILLLIGSLLSLTFNYKITRNSYLENVWEEPEVILDSKPSPKILANFLNSMMSNIQQQIPLLIISAINPIIFIQFALADKIIKSTSGVLWPVIALFQGSVLSSKTKRNRRSSSIETRFTASIGFICIVLIPNICNPFLRLITKNSYEFSFLEATLIGVIVFSIYVNSIQSSVHTVRKNLEHKLLFSNLCSLIIVSTGLFLSRTYNLLAVTLLIILFSYLVNAVLMRYALKVRLRTHESAFPN